MLGHVSPLITGTPSLRVAIVHSLLSVKLFGQPSSSLTQYLRRYSFKADNMLRLYKCCLAGITVRRELPSPQQPLYALCPIALGFGPAFGYFRQLLLALWADLLAVGSFPSRQKVHLFEGLHGGRIAVVLYELSLYTERGGAYTSLCPCYKCSHMLIRVRI